MANIIATKIEKAGMHSGLNLEIILTLGVFIFSPES
jgi:hypothetical protein